MERTVNNMTYKVLDRLRLGENTSITIEGKGENLHNQMMIFDSDNVAHVLISVGMPAGEEPDRIGDSTTILVEGDFNSDIITV